MACILYTSGSYACIDSQVFFFWFTNHSIRPAIWHKCVLLNSDVWQREVVSNRLFFAVLKSLWVKKKKKQIQKY